MIQRKFNRAAKPKAKKPVPPEILIQRFNKMSPHDLCDAEMVLAVTKMSKTELWMRVAKGKFTKALMLDQCIAWLAEDVRQWLEHQNKRELRNEKEFSYELA